MLDHLQICKPLRDTHLCELFSFKTIIVASQLSLAFF